eukprot:2593332-Rhodomonas_salina.1
MEAVKQGSACIGVRSATHALVACFSPWLYSRSRSAQKFVCAVRGSAVTPHTRRQIALGGNSLLPPESAPHDTTFSSLRLSFPSFPPVPSFSSLLGVRSKTHAVLTALKRSTNDMSSFQEKVVPPPTRPPSLLALTSPLLLSSSLASSALPDLQGGRAHGDCDLGPDGRRALAVQVHAHRVPRTQVRLRVPGPCAAPRQRRRR